MVVGDRHLYLFVAGSSLGISRSPGQWSSLVSQVPLALEVCSVSLSRDRVLQSLLTGSSVLCLGDRVGLLLIWWLVHVKVWGSSSVTVLRRLELQCALIGIPRTVETNRAIQSSSTGGQLGSSSTGFGGANAVGVFSPGSL